MTLRSDIESAFSKDIDDVVAWGRRVSSGQSAEAYQIAAEVLSAPNSLPVSRIKALALMQVLLQHHSQLKESDLSRYVDILAAVVKSTEHAELQYATARVMAQLLADCKYVSDDSFDNGISLLRCLTRTSVFPHSRDSLRVLFSRKSP